MLKKKLKLLKFKIAMYKVNRLHLRSMKFMLQSLWIYMRCIYKIGIPKNDKELELLQKAHKSYKEHIKYIEDDINKYKKFIPQ